LFHPAGGFKLPRSVRGAGFGNRNENYRRYPEPASPSSQAPLRSLPHRASPLVRHLVKFLIPDGYVGLIEVKYGENNTPALPIKNGTFICRIPDSGLLRTSSPLEDGWAKDEYFYYSKDGSMHALKDTGWGLGGMIWGGSAQWQQAPIGSKPAQVAQFFYVGTEERYHHQPASSYERPPFNKSASDRIAP
jgi:hypothetical protein